MKALASPGREGDEVKVKVYGSRTCKPNFVRRIAPAGRSFLWAAHYCGALATYPKVLRAEPARACNRRSQTPFLFGLAPCVVCPARCITAAAVRSYRTFSPLPSSRKMGRYVLCGTFRRTGLNPASRTLSGTLLCGVRTFLSPRPKTRKATVRSSCQRLHYNLGFRLAEGGRPPPTAAPIGETGLIDLIHFPEPEPDTGPPNLCTSPKPSESR